MDWKNAGQKREMSGTDKRQVKAQEPKPRLVWELCRLCLIRTPAGCSGKDWWWDIWVEVPGPTHWALPRKQRRRLSKATKWLPTQGQSLEEKTLLAVSTCSHKARWKLQWSEGKQGLPTVCSGIEMNLLFKTAPFKIWYLFYIIFWKTKTSEIDN